MKFIWIQKSINANRAKTVMLTVLFPLFVLLLAGIAFSVDAVSSGMPFGSEYFRFYVLQNAATVLAIVFPIMLIRFIIAFALHRRLIFKFSGAKAIERKDYPELFNIVENLCISRGLPIPNIGIMADDSLNAFATGWKPEKSRIVFSRGLINKLEKREIESVAAHELTHIMNKDTLLMVCVVVFIGIIATLGEIIIRGAGRVKWEWEGGGKAALAMVLIGIGFLILGYLLFPLIRLAVSRKREYLADAGSVELTKDNKAMISALEKISQDSRIESIKKQTVAAMCIETPFKKDEKTHKVKRFHNLLATHPSIEDRIKALKSY